MFTPCPLHARQRHAAGGAGRFGLGCIPLPDGEESTKGNTKNIIFSIYYTNIHSKHKADLHEKAQRELRRLLRCSLEVISAAEHWNKAGFRSPCGSLVTNNLLWSSLHGQTRGFQLLKLNAGNSDYKRVNSCCNSSILICGGSLVKALGHSSESWGFKPWHCQAALLTSWRAAIMPKNKVYVTNTAFFGFIVT